MRNVEYITNGFGAPMHGLGGWADGVAQTMRLLSTAQSTAQVTTFRPEDAIRQNLYGQPPVFADAAIATYRKFGSSGFKRTLEFVDAVEQAEGALKRFYPNIHSQLSGPNAGAVYKRGIKSMLNTAASRIGLTPLSSAILNGVNQWLNSIPDSSTDPRMLTMPLWLQSMRTWVGYLVAI